MISRVIGSIFLIVGTSIGGGMLALPVVTAGSGFVLSSLLLIATWMVMTMSALLILEVNLWLPEGTNLISMASKTLGKSGVMVCWISCLLLLYCLLCAYLAGGTDLLHSLLIAIDIPSTTHVDTILFIIIFTAIVWRGIELIDKTNRLLMSVKMIAYLLLVMAIAPMVQLHHFVFGHIAMLTSEVMVVVTSFGYATVIPSLRSYLKSDVRKIRLTIIIGSAIPLCCYIVWDFIVQGTILPQQLVAIATKPAVVSQLMHHLSVASGNGWISNTVHLFTSICILTAFLGVSLSLSDFIADGLKLTKQGHQKWLIYLLTFLPPVIIVLFDPGIFIVGLKYAGIFCVIVLMLLPAIMVWRGRYHQKIACGYKLWGDKLLVGFILAVAVLLLLFAMR